MYKDIINYELAGGISKKHLIKVANQIVTDWMKNQEGFIKWEIHSNNEGGFTDIVHWTSKQHAKNAEKEMANIENAGDWFRCYKEGTVFSKNLKVIADF